MPLQKSAVAAALLCVSLVAAAQSEFPAWAYPLTPQPPKPEPEEGVAQRVPGSSAALTISQSRDRFAVPDWHPGDHPAMPRAVSSGRKPDVWACGFCHRPTGIGGPENASLTGLPAAYIEQQVRDLASGARSSALPKRGPHALKLPIAKGVSEDELKEAAAYFASIKPQQMLVV